MNAGFGGNTLMLGAPSTSGHLPPMSGMGTMGMGTMGLGTTTMGTIAPGTMGPIPPAAMPVANISPRCVALHQDISTKSREWSNGSRVLFESIYKTDNWHSVIHSSEKCETSSFFELWEGQRDFT